MPAATGTYRQGSTRYVVAISLVAAIGGFLFGYDLAIFSGAIIFLEKAFSLTPAQLGFAAGSALLGCMAGSAAGGALADRIGRKRTFFVAAILFAASAVGTALPRTLAVFCSFRIAGGVGVGLASVVSPMYIAEVSPARIRGRLVTVNQFAIVVGAISSIIAACILSRALDPSVSWRWMFASECAPIFVFLGCLPWIPNSPRWLLQKDRQGQALRVLARIGGAQDAEGKLAAIRESVRGERGTVAELLAPGVRMALGIAVALAFFQQWTGASPLGMFAPKIFQQGGYETGTDALLQALNMHIFNVPCVILALWLVDKFGRRPLLLWGAAGMGAGLVLLGTLFALGVKGFAVVAAVLLCMLAYQVTLAPLAWLIMSEIFPTRLRARGMAIASIVLWGSAYAAWQTFPVLAAWSERTTGTWAAVFFLYAVVCAAAFIFSWRLVPETRGRTLEEIARWWLRAREQPSEKDRE